MSFKMNSRRMKQAATIIAAVETHFHLLTPENGVFWTMDDGIDYKQSTLVAMMTQILNESSCRAMKNVALIDTLSDANYGMPTIPVWLIDADTGEFSGIYNSPIESFSAEDLTSIKNAIRRVSKLASQNVERASHSFSSVFIDIRCCDSHSTGVEITFTGENEAPIWKVRGETSMLYDDLPRKNGFLALEQKLNEFLSHTSSNDGEDIFEVSLAELSIEANPLWGTW